jgi:hypothetical protein
MLRNNHIQKEANITKYKLCEREFVCLNFAYLYLGLRNESKKKMLPFEKDLFGFFPKLKRTCCEITFSVYLFTFYTC